MVTFGDMSEALYQLRQKYGLYYNPPEQEIFRYAKNMHKPGVNSPSLSQKNTKEDGFPPTPKGRGIQPTIL